MNAAVIGEAPGRLEFEFELRSAIENAGIPFSGGVAWRARSSAVEAGIPDPFNLVTHLDRQGAGRKIITVGSYVNVETFGLRKGGEKQGSARG